jgi:hypothetical protein
MFNRKSGTNNSLLSILSNPNLAEFLDGLTWEYDEYYHAEFIKLEKVSEKSVIISAVLDNMTKLKIGDVAYTKENNTLYRRHPRLPIRKKEIKKSFTITKRAS